MNDKLYQIITLAKSLQTDIETLEKNFTMPADAPALVTTSDTSQIVVTEIPITSGAPNVTTVDVSEIPAAPIVAAVTDTNTPEVIEPEKKTFMGEIIDDVKKVLPFGSYF